MVDVPTPPFGDSVSDESLRERMLESMRSGLDKSEGSLAWSLISPFAVELDRLYDQLDLAVQLGFAQTTYGAFLDARAEEHGVTRLPASKAAGEVTFTGVDATVIPEGVQVSTVAAVGESAQSFVTLEEGVISAGAVTIPVVATVVGADSNVPAGSVTQISTFISGVADVSNADDMAGGSDEETDDELRARLLETLASARGAGTAGDYEVWAEQVPGVGQAFAEPIWNGPGTVRVMVLDEDGDPAGTSLLALVTESLAALAPIGAQVTVDAPDLDTVDVTAALTLEPGVSLAMVQTGISAALEAYFRGLRPGETVIYHEVVAAIVTVPGVADVTSLTLDPDVGGAVSVNVPIASDHVARIGTLVADFPTREFFMTDFDPVAWWRFDEASGPNTADQSAAGTRDLTWAGSPTFQIVGPVQGGDFAIQLDGTDDVATVASEADIELLADMTIEAWVRVDDPVGDQTLISCRASGDPLYEIIWSESNEAWSFYPVGGVGGGVVWNVPSPVGEWHHVAVSIDWRTSDRLIRFYLNGQQVGSQSDSYKPGAAARVVNIGRRAVSNDLYLEGSISELAVFDRVLTGVEINNLYKAGY